MSAILKNLSIEKKKAVIQLGYQLIISAAGRPLSSADDASIDIILNECLPQLGGSSLNDGIANTLWNDAILFSPFLSFQVVSQFSDTEKEAFKQMMLKVAQKDNVYLRMDILSQIFNRTQIY